MKKDYYTPIMIKHLYAPYWVYWLEVQQLLAGDLALQICVTYNILLHRDKVELEHRWLQSLYNLWLEAAKYCTHFRMNSCAEHIKKYEKSVSLS